MNRAETVADRIEDVRKRTPPLKGRKARNEYISKDDFAKHLGVGRAAVYNWTREEKPSYPDEKGRKALAEAGSLGRRVERLEKVVATLERHIFGADEVPGP